MINNANTKNVALVARGPLTGEIYAPGDKSISHRALIFGALAEGETEIRGLLEGEDVLRTAAAMRALGAVVERDKKTDGTVWRVEGAAWRAPDRTLYFGNSGTGMRLAMGAVAGRGVTARFDGDSSLRSRPMRRILDPLTSMGAKTASRDGKAPCEIESAGLKAIDFTLPTPSAQIKSAVLLAALGADGETIIREPAPCRDHTEKMITAFGGAIDIDENKQSSGRIIKLTGGQKLKSAAIDVPGDPSSAAFPIAAAIITPGSEVLVKNVLMNPLRVGFFTTLVEMGADLAYENERELNGETVADIRARYSSLRGVEVPAARAASMIDEYPILAVLAAYADGDTMMRGIEELRVKESDRLAAVEAGLKACNVKTDSGPDWLKISGVAETVEGGAVVATHHDHRIAMSFLVLGLSARRKVAIDDAGMIATSFPTFAQAMNALGADLA